MRHVIGIALASLLFSEPVLVAREIQQTDWSGFSKQVTAMRLAGRSARIGLTGGARVKAKVLGADDAGLEVEATRSTKQWNTSNDRARIPRDLVRSVRFNGRMGSRGRLIGALAGFGGGAGIGAAIAYQVGVDEGLGIILIPVAAVGIAVTGLVAGYFIGRTRDKPAPEFVITGR